VSHHNSISKSKHILPLIRVFKTRLAESNIERQIKIVVKKKITYTDKERKKNVKNEKIGERTGVNLKEKYYKK
jgi:hypothetical protein